MTTRRSLVSEFTKKMKVIRDSGMTKDEIGKVLGCTGTNIYHWTVDTGRVKLRDADKIDKLYNEVIQNE